MDRRDMESDDRLHEDDGRLRPLLRRDDCGVKDTRNLSSPNSR